MYLKLVAIAAACFAIVGCNTIRGAGQDIRAGEQKVEHAFSKPDFNKADRDHDGTLDRDEAKAMPDVARNFDAIDKDHDGTVSQSELQDYTASHQ
ncbi:MAG TPA: hypothetical protein VFB54_02610 [Burkholderiales bacterium]|nr:hypothetical protein [Burkholderiales bacterium]